ncbi:hypothetical protein IKF20_01775 [Candidatus Saccharibacteria bacterium]|nr:hypothetical protein [Candidatus Saccharibacteria bacterium]
MKDGYTQVVARTLGLVFMLFFGLINVGLCFADGNSGHGGGNVNGNTKNGCMYSKTVTTSSCKDGTGRASWHIYKIKNVANTSGGPKYKSSLLSNGGWSFSNSDLKKKCPASKYNYYVAFGWDGWNGRKDNCNKDSLSCKLNVPTHWGPVHRGTYMLANGKKYYPKYNTHSLHTAKQVMDAEEKGTNFNGWRLNEKTGALALYKMWKPDAKSIPNSVGFFCVSLKKVTLKAYAVTTTGEYLNGGKVISSSKVYSGKKATVKKKKISGYTFKGWRKKRKSGSLNPKTTKYSEVIQKDTTVYAVYSENKKVVPDNEETSVMIEVRNKDVNDYSEFDKEVFAKPGDGIEYKAVYRPGVQSAYATKADVVKVNGSEVTNNGTVGSSFSEWKNGFSTIGRKWNEAFSFINGHDIEETRLKSGSIDNNDVGYKLDEKAETNSRIKIVPKSVTFDKEDDKIVADINTGSVDDVAYVAVPYNFETSVKLERANEDTIVYAGESKSIKTEFKINGKTNAETTNDENETYATRADNVLRKIIVYGSGDDESGDPGESEEFSGDSTLSDHDFCEYFDAADCKVEDYGRKNFAAYETETNNSGSFNALDLDAGSMVCVALAMYPADSGSDDNWNDNVNYGEDNAWRISNSICYTVAKKPSLQVWGGNVYSNGIINTALAKKNNIAGYSDRRAFGSWGELGLITSKSVYGFASGASLGYQSSSRGEPWPSYNPVLSDDDTRGNNGLVTNGQPGPGGNEMMSSFCVLSPLTFPNQGCGTSSIEQALSGKMKGAEQIKNNKAAIIKKLIPDGEKETVSAVNNLDDDKDYYYSNKDLVLEESTITQENVVKVVHSEENIIINGDLKYNDMPHNTLSSVPKLMIYAKNIYIKCNVARIDALLMAEQIVKTCVLDDNGSVPEVLGEERSITQLKINGAVIANELDPDRTYGAATGANSIVPAEIINFDPTFYLWAGSDGEVEDTVSGGLITAYTHELAPRF